jgi:hypothetical protein
MSAVTPLAAPNQTRVELDLPSSRGMPRRLRLVARDGCLIAYLFAGGRKGSTTELVYSHAAVSGCSLSEDTLRVGATSIVLTDAEAAKVAEAFRSIGLLVLGLAA